MATKTIKLNHIHTKELQTDRVELRRFIKSDAQDMFNNWMNDDEVSKFLLWKPHQNVKATKKTLRSWIRADKTNNMRWAIVFKETNEVIGAITVNCKNYKKYSCDIGAVLSRKYWNKGIMTECLKTVIEFLFTQTNFNRIQAGHNVENSPSGRVMEKSGMVFEGVLRQSNIDKHGNFYDVAIYSILKSDYINV